MSMWRNLICALLVIAPVAGAAQQSQQAEELLEESDIVVIAHPLHDRDIVVNGRIKARCQPRADDPQNAVQHKAPAGPWVRIEPLADGTGFRAVSDPTYWPRKEWQAELGVWKRVGTALPLFNFREPGAQSPLCVGRKPGTIGGAVQFQKLLDPLPYLCRRVRFTAFVASRKANANFWLNGRISDFGAQGRAVIVGVGGSHGWMPIQVEEGVVPFNSPAVGLGLIVSDGDIWMYDEKLVIVPDEELTPRGVRQNKSCLQAALKRCQKRARQAKAGKDDDDIAGRCEAIQAAA